MDGNSEGQMGQKKDDGLFLAFSSTFSLVFFLLLVGVLL